MREFAARLKDSSIPKFLIGGSITFLVEYGIFYSLYIFLGWNLLLANSLSFAIGLGISFMFNRLWAFKKHDYKRAAHHQAVLYAILAVTNLVMNNLIVGGLKIMGLDPRIGKIIAILIIAAWNFLVYKFIIFKEDNKS
jgi:putative flippase GtrA